MLRVGQKVRVVSSDSVQGKVGEVIAIDDSRKKHTIGVEFATEVPGGHDCDGEGYDGRCKWLSPKQVTSAVSTSRPSIGGSSSNKEKGEPMLKKLTTFLRRTLDKNAKASYKAGFLEVQDNELVATEYGIQQLATYLMTQDKEVSAAMGQIAQDIIDEVEDEEEKSKK